MLDANALDFIFENYSSLVPKLEQLVNSNILRLYITHIQRDEIEKMKKNAKRESIKKL